MIVLIALVMAQPTAPVEVAVPAAVAGDCSRGIYLLTGAEDQTRQPLPEKLTDHRRMGNVLAGLLLAGVSSMKVRTVLDGARADLRLSDQRPSFLFCDPPLPSSPSKSGSGMAYIGNSGNEVSPASFLLVRFEVKDKQRELPVASLSGLGAGDKTVSKFVIPVEVLEIGPGMHEVKPKSRLKPGEYGFIRLNRAKPYATGDDVPKDRVVEFAIGP